MTDQETYSDPTEIRHRIGAEGYLRIQSVSGTVELRAGGTDEVVVIARSGHGRVAALPIVVQKTEGGLHIEVSKRSFEALGGWLRRNDESVEFEATVPRRARVEISTVSADISSRFLAGDQTYKSVSGDIELDPDGGRVHTTTVSGDVEVRAAEPIELSISSTSGDIEVQGAVLTSFEARTVSGDIEFEAGLAAGPMHSVETVSGDLSVKSTTGVTVDVKRGMDLARGGGGGFVAGDGSARLRFRTLSGDCHVEGAQREERQSGRQHHRRRHERQAERVAQRVMSRLNPDDFVPPMPPMPPMPDMPPMPPMPPFGDPAPARRPAVDELEVLRALERGEIDVDEAARRLQEA